MFISMQAGKNTWVSERIVNRVSSKLKTILCFFFSIAIACESYHLPPHIAHHVDLVTPTVHFNAIIPRSSEPDHNVRDAHSEGPVIKSGNPGHSFVGPVTVGDSSEVFNNLSTCDEYITPACLRALYGLSYKPVAEDKNSFAIGTYNFRLFFVSFMY